MAGRLHRRHARARLYGGRQDPQQHAAAARLKFTDATTARRESARREHRHIGAVIAAGTGLMKVATQCRSSRPKFHLQRQASQPSRPESLRRAIRGPRFPRQCANPGRRRGPMNSRARYRTRFQRAAPTGPLRAIRRPILRLKRWESGMPDMPQGTMRNYNLKPPPECVMNERACNPLRW